ncbi:CCDC146 [Symbiodinium microadriaticum]|nr:CCDC146 [Symbiodinium microadriaticum]
MLDLKDKYEKAVEERNVTGVQLIDRNDELCILYERSNQQQEALKRGELELRRKEEEVRMLTIQTDELKRQYEAAIKRIPDIAKHQKRIAELEDVLLEERHHTDELSAKLEDPGNTDRWRPLDGEDASIEQLISKSRVLEERLDVKREQLLEKELILEEVTSLTERLKTQAVARKDSSKSMADELNSLQSRIRDTTKKMLASVSELSMYQATALRLQQEKVAREKALEEAKWRFEHGDAPTEDAVKEYNRTERQRMALAETAMRREEELQMTQTGGLHKSTAEPRPTAYIPDDIGIPKPYGNAAPFKPSELGSTMRHMRLPNPKPIEL